MQRSQTIHHWAFLLLAIMAAPLLRAQDSLKVGVILSGGGARGAAHVGFLKALEECGVEVDCIVGTSIGALVGGYYAAGWTPDEMEQALISGEFRGRISPDDERARNLYKNGHANPAVVDVRFSNGSGWVKSNIKDSFELDWSLIEELGPASALIDEDFDQLLIPFRCIGSDVVNAKDTVFANGDLMKSIRASMAFPFYLSPVWMDGNPIYDGGLFNNLPIDVMQREFDPDVILVSDVQSEMPDFSSNDLLSQMEALISHPQSNHVETDSIVIFKPTLKSKTFGFDQFESTINEGYDFSNKKLKNNILNKIDLSENLSEFKSRRNLFRAALVPFELGSCQVTGLTQDQNRLFERFFDVPFDADRTLILSKNAALLASDDYIGSVLPTVRWDDSTNVFDLNLEIDLDRELRIEVGGSAPSNQNGFVFAGLTYHRFSKVPTKLRGSAAFGNLYNAGDLKLQFDFYQKLPFTVEVFARAQRLEYSRSLTTFFHELRPTFMTMEDQEWGARLFAPAGQDGVLSGQLAQLKTTDQSYQEWLFELSDTADIQRFNGLNAELNWQFDRLDDPQFPRSGSGATIRLQRQIGMSEAVFRSPDDPTVWNERNRQLTFFRLRAEGQWWTAIMNEKLAFGLHGQVAFSDELLRSTYRASLAQAMAYQPMLGSKALFLESFRAFNFVGAGAIVDAQLMSNVFIRGELHAFQALPGIYSANKGPGFRTSTPTRWMSGVRLRTNSPMGPVSLGIEYFERERDPWFFELHMGYRLFQNSVRR